MGVGGLFMKCDKILINRLINILIDHSLMGLIRANGMKIMSVNITWLKIQTSRGQTSWLYASVVS